MMLQFGEIHCAPMASAEGDRLRFRDGFFVYVTANVSKVLRLCVCKEERRGFEREPSIIHSSHSFLVT
jgi:hypothetical protein